MADYLKFVEFDLLPSADSELSVKDVSTVNIKEKLYSGTISSGQTYDWSVYLKESKDILQPKIVSEEPIVEDVKVNKEPVQPKQTTNKSLHQNVKKNRGLLKFIPQHTLYETGKILKKIGTGLKNGGKATLKFAAENPEVVIAGIATVVEVIKVFADSNSEVLYVDTYEGEDSIDEDYLYSVDNDENFETEYCSVSDVTDYEESYSGEAHNYPDERKSPIVHIAHRGETTYLRGGTDDDKQAFREENNLDF